MALAAEFYDRPVVTVARDLIGCVVSHAGCSGVIVETEAYHASEPASHAYVGIRPRTEALFGRPGHAYVYVSYGIHYMLNAACEAQGTGAGVLIRALEPLAGIDVMAERRGISPARLRELCSGPGKLTQALAISLADNGSDLMTGPVRIDARAPERGAPAVSVSVRIGITKAVDLPWRFCASGSKYLSRAG